MRRTNRKAPFPWATMSILVFVAILVLVIVIVYSSSEKKRIIEDTGKELESIAGIKADQIVRWHREKVNDARMVYENQTLIEQVEALFTKSGNEKEEILISQFLNSLIKTYDFGSIVLLDAGGNPGLGIPESEMSIGANLRSRLTTIIAEPRISISDLHGTPVVDYLHLDLVVPMMLPQEKDTVLTGILIFRIDPAKELLPLIATWPTGSESSESILFRLDNDSVTYLSESRHKEQGIKMLQRSKGVLEHAAIKANLEKKRFTKGTDYRDKEVIASVRPVPGTKWYIITKTDTSEILDQFRRETTALSLLTLLAILTFAFVAILVVRVTKARFFKEKDMEKRNRHALIKHFDFVMKHGNDLILLFDRDFNIVEANDRAVETYGYPREKLLGMNVAELRTQDSINLLSDHLQSLQSKGSSYIETVHERSNGTTFPVEITAHLVEVDGIRYYQSIGRDITERKQAEEEMRDSNRKLNTIINNLRGVVFHCLDDKDWTMKYISDGIYELAGYLPNEFMNNKIRSYESIIDPEDRQMVRETIHKALNTGYLYAIEYRIITSSGNRKWVWERGRGYYEEEKLVALEGFISDITDRKRIEEELIRSKEKAEQSDRLKTAFLHNISHEIRTPMNAIIGFTALLDTPDLSEENRRQYIDIMYQSSNQLLSIITDIVDISNIETGQVKVTRNAVNLNTLMKNLYEQYRLRAHQHNLELLYTTQLSNEEAIIMTDDTKIIQIISNLLNNALKFTKQGKVEFGYVLREENIEFYVSDTGIGISSDFHEKVFERFYQVESPTTKQFSGTGLGLSISKAYTELLGGKIWLKSTPGEGSVFCFSVPYQKDVTREETKTLYTNDKL